MILFQNVRYYTLRGPFENSIFAFLAGFLIKSDELIPKREQRSFFAVVEFVIGHRGEPDLFSEKGAEIGSVPEFQFGGDLGR